MNQDSDLLAIYCLNHNPAPPIKVNIEVNGFVVPMEVDTGALTSLLLTAHFIINKMQVTNIVGKLFYPNQ